MSKTQEQALIDKFIGKSKHKMPEQDYYSELQGKRLRSEYNRHIDQMASGGMLRSKIIMRYMDKPRFMYLLEKLTRQIDGGDSSWVGTLSMLNELIKGGVKENKVKHAKTHGSIRMPKAESVAKNAARKTMGSVKPPRVLNKYEEYHKSCTIESAQSLLDEVSDFVSSWMFLRGMNTFLPYTKGEGGGSHEEYIDSVIGSPHKMSVIPPKKTAIATEHLHRGVNGEAPHTEQGKGLMLSWQDKARQLGVKADISRNVLSQSFKAINDINDNAFIRYHLSGGRLDPHKAFHLATYAIKHGVRNPSAVEQMMFFIRGHRDPDVPEDPRWEEEVEKKLMRVFRYSKTAVDSVPKL